jgi:hypothetical protein
MIGLQRFFQVKLSELSFSRILEAIRVRLIYIPQLIIWNLPWGFNKLNRSKLKDLNNLHKDKKRCFIVASGPSLKEINFDLLKDEITFAMNRAYMMKDQIGFTPTYLCCVDKYSQLLQFTKKYDDFDEIPTFYNWDLRRLFKKKDNRYFIKVQFSPKFLTNLPGLFGKGKSVTYVCIQLAFVMGFEEVYLIGKDHSYNTIKKVGEKVVSSGNDGNHFLKNYYNKGQVYIAPDYIGEEFAYKVSRDVFEKNNRIIKDATINGKLNVFEKIDFYDLFD